MPMQIFNNFEGSQFYASLTLAGVGDTFEEITEELEAGLIEIESAVSALQAVINSSSLQQPSGIDDPELSTLDSSVVPIDTKFTTPPLNTESDDGDTLTEEQRAAMARYAVDSVDVAPVTGIMADRQAAAARSIGFWTPAHGAAIEATSRQQMAKVVEAAAGAADTEGVMRRQGKAKALTYNSNTYAQQVAAELERAGWEEMRIKAAFREWETKSDTVEGWAILTLTKMLKVQNQIAALALGTYQTVAQMLNVSTHGSGAHRVTE